MADPTLPFESLTSEKRDTLAKAAAEIFVSSPGKIETKMGHIIDALYVNVQKEAQAQVRNDAKAAAKGEAKRFRTPDHPDTPDDKLRKQAETALNNEHRTEKTPEERKASEERKVQPARENEEREKDSAKAKVKAQEHVLNEQTKRVEEYKQSEQPVSEQQARNIKAQEDNYAKEREGKKQNKP